MSALEAEAKEPASRQPTDKAWREIIGDEEFDALTPSLREGFLAIGSEAQRIALGKLYKGHGMSRAKKSAEARQRGEQSNGWTGALLERARLDCLRALLGEGSEEALAAGERLMSEIGPAALAKSRGWGGLSRPMSAIECVCWQAGKAARDRPNEEPRALETNRRWGRALSQFAALKPERAAMVTLRGGLDGGRQQLTPSQAESIIKTAVEAIDWFKGPAAEASSEPMEISTLAQAALEIANSMAPSSVMTRESADLLERAWRSFKAAGVIVGPPDMDLLHCLMFCHCSPEAPEVSLRLAEIAVELGAAPADGFQTLASQALEPGRNLRAVIERGYGVSGHGLNVWIAKLCEEGMDTCAIDQGGVSMLCLINERIKSSVKGSSMGDNLRFELAAQELLARGADPSLAVPRLDPLEQAASPGMRALLVSAMEKLELEKEAKAGMAAKKKAPGI